MLEYQGRADDVVVIGLMNVCHKDFQNALSRLPISELQLVARQNDEGDLLVLRVECHESTGELKNTIYETVLSNISMIKHRLETGELRSFEVELHAPGTLPRNPSSDKIKRIIDERN